VSILVIDCVVTGLYIIEFVYEFYYTKKPRKNFFYRWTTWIDIITIVVPIVEILYEQRSGFFNVPEIDSDTGLNFKTFRILRILKVLRILRIHKLLVTSFLRHSGDNDY